MLQWARITKVSRLHQCLMRCMNQYCCGIRWLVGCIRSPFIMSFHRRSEQSVNMSCVFEIVNSESILILNAKQSDCTTLKMLSLNAYQESFTFFFSIRTVRIYWHYPKCSLGNKSHWNARIINTMNDQTFRGSHKKESNCSKLATSQTTKPVPLILWGVSGFMESFILERFAMAVNQWHRTLANNLAIHYSLPEGYGLRCIVAELWLSRGPPFAGVLSCISSWKQGSLRFTMFASNNVSHWGM